MYCHMKLGFIVNLPEVGTLEDSVSLGVVS